MIKINEKLTVLHDDDGSFVDMTRECASFDRDEITISYDSTEDYIYIGFYKPINTFYVKISHDAHADDGLTIDYYNGSTFASVSGLYDDTNGLERSGFIRWGRNQTSESETEINSVTQYWYRMNVTDCSHNITFEGLNIVFSDDQDLKREYYDIENYKSTGESTFILTHAAARDEIIQELRADGRYKEDLNTGKLKNISAFDLLDISQVKLASTYLVLSKIFLQASDEVDDSHMQKSDKYRSLYNKCMSTMYLSVDEDDDGELDSFEELPDNTGTMVRR